MPPTLGSASGEDALGNSGPPIRPSLRDAGRQRSTLKASILTANAVQRQPVTFAEIESKARNPGSSTGAFLATPKRDVEKKAQHVAASNLVSSSLAAAIAGLSGSKPLHNALSPKASPKRNNRVLDRPGHDGAESLLASMLAAEESAAVKVAAAARTATASGGAQEDVHSSRKVSTTSIAANVVDQAATVAVERFAAKAAAAAAAAASETAAAKAATAAKVRATEETNAEAGAATAAAFANYTSDSCGYITSDSGMSEGESAALAHAGIYSTDSGFSDLGESCLSGLSDSSVPTSPDRAPVAHEARLPAAELRFQLDHEDQAFLSRRPLAGGSLLSMSINVSVVSAEGEARIDAICAELREQIIDTLAYHLKRLQGEEWELDPNLMVKLRPRDGLTPTPGVKAEWAAAQGWPLQLTLLSVRRVEQVFDVLIDTAG